MANTSVSHTRSQRAYLSPGCRVLVSRAKKQAGALSSALRELGCDVIEIPFIEIRKPRSYQPLDSALRQLAMYDWLILTSVNGVEATVRSHDKKKINALSVWHILKIAAIGPATRKAIEQHGLQVVVTPKEYVAESVVASLAASSEREARAAGASEGRARCHPARVTQGRRRG